MASLVKKIDTRINEAAPKYKPNQKLGTFVIMPDAAGRADQLRCMAKQNSLSRVTLCLGAAPPRYEINPAADVTVVVYTPGRPGQNRVTANFALRQAELDDCMSDKIIEALSNVLPK
ncbi:MAG: hypothetical protein HYX68_18625 [Planctomycetes bacterium]|nr:hypothetical protein [Planctomycetota bacterium]